MCLAFRVKKGPWDPVALEPGTVGTEREQALLCPLLTTSAELTVSYCRNTALGRLFPERNAG